MRCAWRHDCCLGPDWEIPFRTPGKKDKPFQSSGIRAGWF
jgi:hypothetical protein